MQAVEEDNNLIYNDIIPNESALAEIEKVIIAKAKPYNESMQFTTNFQGTCLGILNLRHLFGRSKNATGNEVPSQVDDHITYGHSPTLYGILTNLLIVCNTDARCSVMRLPFSTPSLTLSGPGGNPPQRIISNNS